MAAAAEDASDATRPRRSQWGRGPAVALVLVVAALVWFVVPTGSSADAGETSSPASASKPAPGSTTTAPTGPVTVYGCAITDGAADADCTDASVVAEYCTIPRESIATPGTEERTDTSLTRTYETAAGIPAGSVTHFDPGTGLPEYPVTLLCATKRTFGFTAADAESFVQPA